MSRRFTLRGDTRKAVEPAPPTWGRYPTMALPRALTFEESEALTRFEWLTTTWPSRAVSLPLAYAMALKLLGQYEHGGLSAPGQYRAQVQLAMDHLTAHLHVDAAATLEHIITNGKLGP